jgi:hypothetical protein
MLSVLKRSWFPVAAVLWILSTSAVCRTQDTVATYPVRGVVLNSITHRPIARALVNGQEDAVLTDNDGRFELNLSEGTTQILVKRPGFGANRIGMVRAHSVKVGANMPELTFYLTPDATITGHVLVAGGEDADQIRVIAMHKQVFNGHAIWQWQGMHMTDSEGMFHIENVEAPGSYLLCTQVSQDEWAPAASAKTTYGYPATCYPGVTDLSAAGSVTVSPGQQVEVEFPLTRQPFYPVSIGVSNHAHGQPAGVMIREASGHGGSGIIPRWNATLNTTEVNLPNGHYTAEINVRGKTSSYGRLDFQVAGGPVLGLSLVESPLRPIQVEIQKEFTGDKNGVVQTVGLGGSAGDTGPGMNMSLVPLDSNTFQSGGAVQAVPGSADHNLFEMNDVAPGTYRVQTFAFQGYVASIRSGAVDLARDPLVVGAGDTTPPIEVTLRDDGGSIRGTVRTGALGSSVPGQDVGETSMVYAYAIPQFANPAQIPMSVSSGGSAVVFGNLAPGPYRVVAFDQPQEIDMEDQQALARLTGGGQTVTVEAGGTATVQLDMVKTAGEEGTR